MTASGRLVSVVLGDGGVGLVTASGRLVSVVLGDRITLQQSQTTHAASHVTVTHAATNTQ